jgi:hypothetical protein
MQQPALNRMLQQLVGEDEVQAGVDTGGHGTAAREVVGMEPAGVPERAELERFERHAWERLSALGEELQARGRQRRAALERLMGALQQQLGLAELLQAEDVCAELEELLGSAARWAERLAGCTASAPGPVVAMPALAPEGGASRAMEEVEAPRRAAAAEAAGQAEPPMAGPEAAAIHAAPALEPEGLRAAEQPAPAAVSPAEAGSNGARQHAPREAAVAEARGTVAVRPLPAEQWTARPREELETEREAILAELQQLPEKSGLALARFKRLCARYRAGHLERRRYEGAQDDWHRLHERLRAVLDERWPGQFCPPLTQEPTLDPPRWLTLAEHYASLETAVEALSWVQSQRTRQPQKWLDQHCRETLESIGAVLKRIDSFFKANMPGKKDPQVATLDGSLLEIGGQRRSTSAKQVAERLGKELAQLREATEAAQRREEALAALEELLADGELGQGEEDADRICDAAHRCLEAGVPPTLPRLRDPLLDWAYVLEEDERLQRLFDAVQEEVERVRAARNGGGADPEDDEAPLAMEQLRMLEELRHRTEGKRAVIIGGRCHEENRLRIQEAFRFAEVRWPTSEPSDSFGPAVNEILRADLVFLTRFNRRRAREAHPVCREEGKPLVVLPKGYGLNEVISRTWASFTRAQRLGKE